MKSTLCFGCPVFRSWTHSMSTRTKYTVATWLFIAFAITYFNRYLLIRPAARRERSDALIQGPVQDASHTALAPVSAAGAEDALFHRLHQLLTVVDPGATAQCLRRYGAGGRCFHCATNKDSSIAGYTDGSKPVCLTLLQANCSVLSFGINHDFSFDEVMEDLGCTVHAFDPTMGVNSYRRSKGIHFHSLGIGASDSNLGGFSVASLGSIVHKIHLQPGVIDYLKLDVETSEWEMLQQQLTTAGDLLRVKQLNIEFHLFQWSPQIAEGTGMKPMASVDSAKVSYEDAVRFAAVLEELRRAGFGLVSSDANSLCYHYNGGCLSFIYDTHWVNKKVKGTFVA